jgi:hypothetical protein
MMPEAMRRAGPRGLSFAVALATLSALAVASVSFGACTHTPQPVARKNSRAEAERPAAAGPIAAGAPAGAAATAATPAGAAGAEQGSKAGATAATSAIDRNAAAPAAAGAGAPAAAAVDGTVKEKEGTFVIVDPADPATDTRTLAEAGKAEKERRANAPRPKVVITNKTLKHYATGQLTVADPKKKGEGAKETTAQRTANGGGGPPSAIDAARDEWYWRHRVIEIRQHWRRAVDRVKELEESAADWRRRFYSQDDPYVRDGQIKPSWDRALDELRQSKAEVEASKRDLAAALEEGRLKGALPGWLREGIDLEPAEPKPVNPTESIEPPIVKEPPINLPPQT